MDDAAPRSAGSQYAQPATWYDHIYAAQGKDYEAEAACVDAIIRSRMPGATSLLDVGCGTGMHLLHLSERFADAAGVDLDERFVGLARARGLDVTAGDMRSFDVGRTFDAVTCLYSGIGHLGSVAELDAAIATMTRHLVPGGVLVVEPWVAPDAWRAGEFGVEVVDGPDWILTRVNHTGRDGDVSVLDFEWTHVDAAGITRLQEQLRLTCFTEHDHRSAFERAGLRAEFDEAGCNDDGRGLWIGVR